VTQMKFTAIFVLLSFQTVELYVNCFYDWSVFTNFNSLTHVFFVA
jgi:hypothetical protein